MLDLEKIFNALNNDNSNLNLQAVGKDLAICALGGIVIGGYICCKKIINRDTSYFPDKNKDDLD